MKITVGIRGNFISGQKEIIYYLGSQLFLTYVEAKEHIDLSVQNKRRVSFDGTASEMSISYGKIVFKSVVRDDENILFQ